jgi:hypothetical protein
MEERGEEGEEWKVGRKGIGEYGRSRLASGGEIKGGSQAS